MGKKLTIIGAALLAPVFLLQLVFAGLTYEGSSTIGENIMPDLVKAFEAKANVKFDKVGVQGSGKGYKAVMAGSANVGGMSRALTTEEKKDKPYYQIIGYDAIAIWINEKNPIKDLSKDQIKDIFTGKITNWKDVGGNDAPITVVTEVKTGDRATIKEFKEMALDGAEFGTTKEIDKPRDCVKYIGTDENSITHASIAFKEMGAKAISVDEIEPTADNIRSGMYLLSRPLCLVSKDIPAGDLKKFFDFVFSAEGQAIVGKNFVSVK